MRVSYVRMYSGADGESHFEDLTHDLVQQDFAPPAAPSLVGTFLDASGTLFFAARPGWGGEVPHPSPQRQVFCFLRGVVEVTVSDGERRCFSTGDVVIVDDTRGKGYATRVVGADDVVVFGTILADQEPAIGPFPPRWIIRAPRRRAAASSRPGPTGPSAHAPGRRRRTA